MYSNHYTFNYNPFDYGRYLRPQTDLQLMDDLQRAINGEYSAIACYEKLARLTRTEEEREQILEIQADERRHFEEFSRIYTNLTGQKPIPKIIEECPGTYRAGLKAAFIDEQKTVDFYLDIAANAQSVIIKESFKRAAADEQNHAVWFLFFLNNSRM